MVMSVTVAGRRAVGRGGVALAGVAVALTAAGCNGASSASQSTSSTSTTATVGGSSPPPSATPSASPSDQQAQAYGAAVKTYNEYWAGLEQILKTGGDPLKIRPVARGEAFSYAIAVSREASASGYRIAGTLSNVYVRPSDFTFGGTTKNPSRVKIQGCQNVGSAHYVDRNGKPVPTAPGAAKSVRVDATVVNFSPVLNKNWVLDDLKTTAVKSCS
jgi:hypothetical protein